MRIPDLYASSRPVFSFEFFPPKSEEGVDALLATVEQLRPLGPAYASVTYGAGGATRDGTLESASRSRNAHRVETVANLR